MWRVSTTNDNFVSYNLNEIQQKMVLFNISDELEEKLRDAFAPLKIWQIHYLYKKLNLKVNFF